MHSLNLEKFRKVIFRQQIVFNIAAITGQVQSIKCLFLWPLCVADADIIFLSRFFLLFIPRLISAVADWMSTILPHVMWP